MFLTKLLRNSNYTRFVTLVAVGMLLFGQVLLLKTTSDVSALNTTINSFTCRFESDGALCNSRPSNVLLDKWQFVFNASYDFFGTGFSNSGTVVSLQIQGTKQMFATNFTLLQVSNQINCVTNPFDYRTKETTIYGEKSITSLKTFINSGCTADYTTTYDLTLSGSLTAEYENIRLVTRAVIPNQEVTPAQPYCFSILGTVCDNSRIMQGVAYNDWNNSGIFDPTETGIYNTAVQVFDTVGANVFVDLTELDQGQWSIDLINLDKKNALTGALDFQIGNDIFSTLIFTSDPAFQVCYRDPLGLSPSAAISFTNSTLIFPNIGFTTQPTCRIPVYEDLNENGVFERPERLFRNAKVDLYARKEGFGTYVVKTYTTDNTGYFDFDGFDQVLTDPTYLTFYWLRVQSAQDNIPRYLGGKNQDIGTWPLEVPLLKTEIICAEIPDDKYCSIIDLQQGVITTKIVSKANYTNVIANPNHTFADFTPLTSGITMYTNGDIATNGTTPVVASSEDQTVKGNFYVVIQNGSGSNFSTGIYYTNFTNTVTGTVLPLCDTTFCDNLPPFYDVYTSVESRAATVNTTSIYEGQDLSGITEQQTAQTDNIYMSDSTATGQSYFYDFLRFDPGQGRGEYHKPFQINFKIPAFTPVGVYTSTIEISTNIQ